MRRCELRGAALPALRTPAGPAPSFAGRFTASDERTKLGAMRETGGATSARVRPRHRASLTRPRGPSFLLSRARRRSARACAGAASRSPARSSPRCSTSWTRTRTPACPAPSSSASASRGARRSRRCSSWASTATRTGACPRTSCGGVERAGLKISDDQLRVAFESVDENGDGVTMREFERVRTLLPRGANAAAAFDAFVCRAFVDDAESEYTVPRDLDETTSPRSWSRSCSAGSPAPSAAPRRKNRRPAQDHPADRAPAQGPRQGRIRRRPQDVHNENRVARGAPSSSEPKTENQRPKRKGPAAGPGQARAFLFPRRRAPCTARAARARSGAATAPTC